MNYLNYSIAIILGSLCGGLLWDAFLAFRGKLRDGCDYCDGLRAINRYTGGLLALILLAIWWHCFGWIPENWR